MTSIKKKLLYNFKVVEKKKSYNFKDVIKKNEVLKYSRTLI